MNYIYEMRSPTRDTSAPRSPFGSERFARRRGSRLTAFLAVLGVLVSMVVMATPASAGVADAPTAVTAVGFNGSAVVWFTAPASDGGFTITEYTVTATDSTTSANGGQTCTTTDPSAGCTVAGLTNGDSYTFTVTATNSSGTSAASTASSAVVPAWVTVTSLGSGSMSSHSCVVLSNGTAQCWGSNSSGQLGDNTTTSRYTPVRVKGVGGVGLLTRVSSIAVGAGYTCALLTTGYVDCWGDNTYGQLGNNSNSSSYTPKQVYAVGSTSASSLLSGVSSIATGGNHVCALLTAGGVDCWGNNSSGQVGDNTNTRRTTPVAVIAAAPTSPTVASGGSGAATVSWTGSLSALTYTVTATDTTTPANGGQTCVSSTLSCTISGLTSGDSYTFAVTSYTGFLTSTASASSSAFTVPATAPSSPTSLVATPGNGSVSIEFTAGATGGSEITNYKYSTDNGASWTTRSPEETTSPLLIEGLTNGTPYTIKLRAVNSVGDGTASAAVSSTPRTTPSAPTGLVATAGDGSASIAFTAGETGGSAITNYKYSIDDGGNWSLLDPADVASPVTISGLTNGTPYDIKLLAVNVAGDGTASSSVAVTPRSVPEAPTLTLVTPGDSSVEVAFTAGL